jgi:hypothetical protein
MLRFQVREFVLLFLAIPSEEESSHEKGQQEGAAKTNAQTDGEGVTLFGREGLILWGW